MILDEERLKLLKELLGEDYVEGVTDLSGIDLAPLMLGSSKSGFIRSFLTATEPAINGLLFNGKVSDFVESKGLPTPEQIESERKSLLETGECRTSVFKYRPMNLDWVKQIIEMDQVMRASKAGNNEPTVVYRGTSEVKMNGLTSTTLNKHVAMRFYRGSMLKINLPAGFPTFAMHLLTGRTNKVYASEKEIVLPPCECEVVKTYTEEYTYKDPGQWPLAGVEYEYIDEGPEEGSIKCKINVIEIDVRPISLAKALLSAMENLPPDYPKEYVEDPAFEYKKSLQILWDYVNNELESGKITVGNTTIQERKDPEIIFNSEYEDELY